jgi:hypothetical protein
MKARIRQDGVMVIETETDLEDYALQKWLADNQADDEGRMPAHGFLFVCRPVPADQF